MTFFFLFTGYMGTPLTHFNNPCEDCQRETGRSLLYTRCWVELSSLVPAWCAPVWLTEGYWLLFSRLFPWSALEPCPTCEVSYRNVGEPPTWVTPSTGKGSLASSFFIPALRPHLAPFLSTPSCFFQSIEFLSVNFLSSVDLTGPPFNHPVKRSSTSSSFIFPLCLPINSWQIPTPT